MTSEYKYIKNKNENSKIFPKVNGRGRYLSHAL